ncbi:MAG: fibronectin type III domain-containing protein [Acidobacteria bacterium]|nr:fibronectin type III domain-containing protein [Acidobacteriota bacterium]
MADIGNVANALPFDETFRGNEVAYIHLEAFQPPFGASPLVSGDPLPIVWDEDSNGPSYEFVIKGRKLRIPTSGVNFDDWPVEFTRNAAAVRLWEVLSFEGTQLRRVNLPSFIEAYEICDRRLIVDITDDLCNLRLAYRLTDDNVAPALPAGNAWPPPSPWGKNPPKTTNTSKYSWVCHQRKINGVWGDWMHVRRYGRHIVKPDGDPRGETQASRITVSLVTSTGGFRRVTMPRGTLGVGELRAITGYSLDGATVSVSSVRTEEDPGEPPNPDDGEEMDPTNPDDEDPNPRGVEIPPGVNPGDPDSSYCGLFDTDKEVGKYEINGVVTSEDDIQTVRNEMDFAWAGSVVNDGGILYARPGADRDPVAHIDATSEDVEVMYAQSAPPLNDRINACSLSLANSRTNGFKPYTMPRLVDRQQAALDGKIINRNLGTRGYLTSPTGAKLLQRQELAAARPLNVYTYRVPIEYSRELWSAIPGDRITVHDPDRGLNPVITRNQGNPLFHWGDGRGRYMRVLGRSLNFNQGLTMDFSVVAHPDGTFSRSGEFPSLEPDPSIPGNFVDAPTGLVATEETYVDADGKVRSRIRVRWHLNAAARTLVQWRPIIPYANPDFDPNEASGPSNERFLYESLSSRGSDDDLESRSSLSRPAKAPMGQASPSSGEWSLAGSDDWTGNLVVSFGGVSAAEWRRMSGIGANDRVLLFADQDNWAACNVVAAPTIASGVAQVSLRYVGDRPATAPHNNRLGSVPSSGSLSLQFTVTADDELVATPEWGSPRQSSTSGAELVIDDVRIGVAYELRILNESLSGINSAPSYSVTVFLTGEVGTLPGLADAAIDSRQGGYVASWTPFGPDTGVDAVEIYEAGSGNARPEQPRTSIARGTGVFTRSGLNAEKLDIWLRGVSYDKKASGPFTKLTVTPLAPPADGQDGLSFEYVFAAYAGSSVPQGLRPDNAWGYDRPGTRTSDGSSLTWTDGAPSLTAAAPNLFRSERRIAGQPTAGDAVTDDWSEPTIVGRYGEKGVPGADGEDGRGYEYIFAIHASQTVAANQLPENDWGFDEPETRNGVEWTDGAENDVTAAKPFLLRAEREIMGVPAKGSAVADDWSEPTVVGRYGEQGVPGVDGEDGLGYEWIFARTASATLKAAQKPSNDWGFDEPGTAGTGDDALVWTDGAPSVQAATPILWRASRRVEGTPTTGTAVADNWSEPTVVGRFVAGADGEDGHGYEYIFAAHDRNAVNQNQLPLNTWGFDQPATRNGVAWQDGAPTLTAAKPILLRCEREIEGVPAVGAAVSDDWDAPVVVGRFGEDGVPGADGEDAHGREYIFCVHSGDSLPTNQRPLNTWGFDEPTTVNGKAWHDGAPSVTLANPVLFRCERDIVGSPTKGAAVSDDWDEPTIVGRYGPKGDKGDAGVPGARGDDGAPGAAGIGVEYAFAASSASSIPSNQLPDNDWGYERQGTVGGLTWHDGSPGITADASNLFRAERELDGSPSAGDAVAANWSTPVIVGHYGRDGVPGAKGEDGESAQGREYVFARVAATVAANQVPEDDWAFDTPEIRNGLAWTDGAPDLTPDLPVLVRCERRVPGTPDKGDTPPSSLPANGWTGWSSPVIVGRYGLSLAVPGGLKATGTYSAPYPVLGAGRVRSIRVTPTWNDVDGADSYRVGIQIVGGTGYTQFFEDVDSGDEVSNPVGWDHTVPGNMVVTVESVKTVAGETFISAPARVLITLTGAAVTLAAPTVRGIPGNARVVLSWGRVTGATAYHYRYRQGDSPTRVWLTVTLGNVLTATRTGLLNDVAQQFQVRAVAGNVLGPWSATITVTPTAAFSASITASPANPVPRSATVVLSVTYTGGSGSLSYAWYIVGQAAVLGSGRQLTVTSSSRYSDSVPYRCVVTRGSESATPTYSVTTVAAPDAPDAPGPIRSLTATPAAQQFRVRFAAPNTGGDPTGYRVRYRAGSTGAWTTHQSSGLSRDTTIRGLTVDTSYQIEVQAFNAGGSSSWVRVTARTPARAAPVFRWGDWSSWQQVVPTVRNDPNVAAAEREGTVSAWTSAPWVGGGGAGAYISSGDEQWFQSYGSSANRARLISTGAFFSSTDADMWAGRPNLGTGTTRGSYTNGVWAMSPPLAGGPPTPVSVARGTYRRYFVSAALTGNGPLQTIYAVMSTGVYSAFRLYSSS